MDGSHQLVLQTEIFNMARTNRN